MWQRTSPPPAAAESWSSWSCSGPPRSACLKCFPRWSPRWCRRVAGLLDVPCCPHWPVEHRNECKLGPSGPRSCSEHNFYGYYSSGENRQICILWTCRQFVSCCCSPSTNVNKETCWPLLHTFATLLIQWLSPQIITNKYQQRPQRFTHMEWGSAGQQ